MKYLKNIFHLKKNIEGIVQVRKKRSMHGKKKKKTQLARISPSQLINCLTLARRSTTLMDFILISKY